MCSGYKTITPIQLLNGIGAYIEGEISFMALRVYFACFELVAIREAARRSNRSGSGEGNGKVCFKRTELIGLTGGLTLRSIGQCLAELKTAGLLLFSQDLIVCTETPTKSAQDILAKALEGRKATRPIPVPRRFIRFLASLNKPSLFLTIAAYIIRGLSFQAKTGTINSRGTVKVSWISEVFGLSPRAVKAARAEMITLGLIGKDEGSTQRKLNRDGSYFELNLEWSANEQSRGGEASSVDNSATPCTEFSPPQVKKCTEFSPPYKYKKTPYGSKHQKTGSGVCKQTISKTNTQSTTPNINDIQPEDFQSFSRNEELYRQARAKGLISGSEADIINWLAATVRARGTHNPAKIFIGIIKGKLWHHITNAQEDQAIARLKKRRLVEPSAFRERKHYRLAA